MKTPWRNKGGLAKAVAILATAFFISLGLCGINTVAVVVTNTGGPGFLFTSAYIELAGLILSSVGLGFIAIFVIGRAIVHHFFPPTNTKGDH
jgi:hypothetical protein